MTNDFGEISIQISCPFKNIKYLNIFPPWLYWVQLETALPGLETHVSGSTVLAPTALG